MDRPERHAHPLGAHYQPGLFRSTATYYERFRPRYPAALINAVRRRLRPQPGDRLLDLACGTGEVTWALRDTGRGDRRGGPGRAEIWAVDAEPEMIAAARRRAALLGVGNVRWTVGRAEDLHCPDGHLAVVAVGRAFHRLDRPLIGARARAWLRPGGAFVDLGIDSAGLFAPSESWLVVAAGVYRRWVPAATAQNTRVIGPAPAPGPQGPTATTEEVLAGAGFTVLEKVELDVPHWWRLDDFVGYLRSTSYASSAFWGDAQAGFERDLRAALLGHDPSGRYREMLAAYAVVGMAP